MSTTTHSKSSLFLMEIIIAIFFFSLASAICLRLFSSAHSLSDQDKNLNNALLWSQNLSESFYGCDGDIMLVKNLYPDAFLAVGEKDSDGTLTIFFNDKWEVIDNALGDASYEAILDVKKEFASNVYSDVNDYGVLLDGDAIAGNIAIIDIKGRSEEYLTIPEDSEAVIFSNKVDVYVGK